MWIYAQRSGALSHNGLIIARGYAGHGKGFNNPALQHVPFVGPLPRGLYTIGSPIERHPRLGYYVLPLTPDASNQMFGRGDFFIHGDAEEHPGNASEGCIVQEQAPRKAVAASGDHRLQVVEDLFDETVRA
jgi:type VI secretion system (T6SS) effector TldE1-like protein